MLGEGHKLVDGDGKYLGVLFTPTGVEASLAERDSWHHAMRNSRIGPTWLGLAEEIPTIRVSVIALSRSFRERGAIELWGISPDDISNHEGFAFLPAADYQAGARKTYPAVEALGIHLTAARDVSA